MENRLIFAKWVAFYVKNLQLYSKNPIISGHFKTENSITKVQQT